MVTKAKKKTLGEALDTASAPMVGSFGRIAAAKTPRPKGGTSRIPPSRVGRVAVQAYVDPLARKQLARLALDEDTTAEALLVEALNMLFHSRGLSRLA